MLKTFQAVNVLVTAIISAFTLNPVIVRILSFWKNLCCLGKLFIIFWKMIYAFWENISTAIKKTYEFNKTATF